jgi:glycosyltransferase involved in cell wall biosynthesis
VRIAQISPLWERVPPPAYGGTEAVVHALTEGLVARGHEVVLYASGDSITSAELRSVYPRSLRTATELEDPHPYEWLHAARALEEAGEFDIIHNHAGELVMAMSQLVTTPVLSTIHCLITRDNKVVWDHYQGYYNTISTASFRSLPDDLANPNFAGVVYNGIDVNKFSYKEQKEDHLLFLSRISPEKAPHLAIEAARKAGMPLLIAGKVDRVDRAYYENVVKPLIDGDTIRYVGEVSREEARDLYGSARALLLPIQWEEPFGLVMPEAMACGTPVIAFRRGAAPEIVVDGETGVLVEDGDIEGMVEAIGNLDRIDPKRCRQHTIDNFDNSRMVDNYLNAYERVLFQARRRSAQANLPPSSGVLPNQTPPEGLREAS